MPTCDFSLFGSTDGETLEVLKLRKRGQQLTDSIFLITGYLVSEMSQRGKKCVLQFYKAQHDSFRFLVLFEKNEKKRKKIPSGEENSETFSAGELVCF